jgi:phage shock protein A
VFRRIWNYIITLGRVKAEAAMDPAIQIEQAMDEARRQDSKLRDQAAKVIAHRSELQMKLDRAVNAAAEAKSNAGEALRQADGASSDAEVEKWSTVAQSLALELEAQEKLVEGLKSQYATATEQAELAKQQVAANAVRVRELAAKRMELLGKLEQAKMQESVNKTMAALDRPLDASGPSLTEIEDKINQRMAMASAKAELGSANDAKRQLDAARVNQAGKARLDALRAELGLGEGAGGAGGAKAVTSGDEPKLIDEGDGGLDELALESGDGDAVPVEQQREGGSDSAN